MHHFFQVFFDTFKNNLKVTTLGPNDSAKDNKMETDKVDQAQTSCVPLTYTPVDMDTLEQSFSSQYYHLRLVAAMHSLPTSAEAVMSSAIVITRLFSTTVSSLARLFSLIMSCLAISTLAILFSLAISYPVYLAVSSLARLYSLAITYFAILARHSAVVRACKFLILYPL